MPVLQYILNPNSSVAQSKTSSYQTTVASTEYSQFGSTFDFAQLDDASTLDETYAASCWGTGSFTAQGYNCTGAPGGQAMSPWDSAYSLSNWINGESALVGAQPLPQIVNGLAGNNSSTQYAAAASVVVMAPNAWGGMCDGCFYTTTNNSLVTGQVLDHWLDGIMLVIGAGKNAILVDENVIDHAARARAMGASRFVCSLSQRDSVTRPEYTRSWAS
jgi:hypothetical protein